MRVLLYRIDVSDNGKGKVLPLLVVSKPPTSGNYRCPLIFITKVYIYLSIYHPSPPLQSLYPPVPPKIESIT